MQTWPEVIHDEHDDITREEMLQFINHLRATRPYGEAHRAATTGPRKHLQRSPVSELLGFDLKLVSCGPGGMRKVRIEYIAKP